MERDKQEVIVFDILVANNATSDALAAALSGIFQIGFGDVFIAENYEDLLNVDMENIKIFCLSSRIRGDFSWLLTLHIYDITLRIGIVDIAKKLSVLLLSLCLIPDDSSINPYDYIAFYPNREPKRIALIADETEGDNYAIEQKQ